MLTTERVKLFSSHFSSIDMSRYVASNVKHVIFWSFSWAFIAYECILSTEISRNQPFSAEECAALVARHVFQMWHL